MHKEQEAELLKNSRLSVLFSAWSPMLIIALVVGSIQFAVGSFILGLVWIGLTIYIYKKMKKFQTNIEGLYIGDRLSQ